MIKFWEVSAQVYGTDKYWVEYVRAFTKEDAIRLGWEMFNRPSWVRLRMIQTKEIMDIRKHPYWAPMFAAGYIREVPT